MLALRRSLYAPYLALFKVRFLVLFQYRSAALAAMVTQLFWGFLKVMIFTALFSYNKDRLKLPLTLSQTLSFIWLSQSFIHLLPWTLDKEFRRQIRTGNVAIELLRPINLYMICFVRALAQRMVPTLMRAIPLFLVAISFLALSTPSSPFHLFCFCLSMILSLFLSAAITTLIMISVFWTIAGEGITRLAPSVVSLLSGVIIPLSFFPEFLWPILKWLPFRGLIDIPSRIYLGLFSEQEVFFSLAFQLIHILLLVFLGTVLMRKVFKNISLQGG